MKEICPGCGEVIQCTQTNAPGYLNPEVYQKKSETFYCERCFKLKHYNQETFYNPNPKAFSQAMEETKKSKALVVLVLSLVDLEGTIIPNLKEFIGPRKVLIVVNKYDLVNKDIKKERLQTYLHKYLKTKDISFHKLLIMSAFKKNEIAILSENIELLRNKENVYFIGATNVGKSSLINEIIFQYTKKSDLLTTSNTVNTTLGSIYIPYDKASYFVDTPGYINPNSLLHYLSKPHLEAITPLAFIKPKVFQLFPEQTLFIQGIIRVDYLAGEKASFITYFCNELLIHRTKTLLADNFYTKHLDQILTIPNQTERLTLGAFSHRDYRFTHQKVDICIPGLGFFTFVGEGTLRIYSFEKIKIVIREAIL